MVSHLAGISYHTVVDRQGIKADAILSATHAVDYLLAMCKVILKNLLKHLIHL